MERHKDDPFALVGVNTDDDLEEIRRIVKEKNLSWRSFYDGSTQGEITKQWRIRGFPTVYIIDHKGVIRHKDVRGEAALDKAIADLVAEAKRDAAK